MKPKKHSEDILQHLEAKVSKLEKLLEDNRWQKAVMEKDLVIQDNIKCLAILDLALSGAPDWREKAIDFLNTTSRNRSNL